jgi:hypothetical protein
MFLFIIEQIVDIVTFSKYLEYWGLQIMLKITFFAPIKYQLDIGGLPLGSVGCYRVRSRISNSKFLYQNLQGNII